MGKSSERIFSWEDVETDSIKDGQNKKKRVRPMPRARPKNVPAKPLKLQPAPLRSKFDSKFRFCLYFGGDVV